MAGGAGVVGCSMVQLSESAESGGEREVAVGFAECILRGVSCTRSVAVSTKDVLYLVGRRPVRLAQY